VDIHVHFGYIERMRLSTQADYAVRAVYELARHEPGAVVHTDAIAAAQRIPGSRLTKVLQELARADLVRTYRGSGGGVALARSPEQITVRQVYEAVEGPVLLCRCRQRVEPCGDDPCDTHDFWQGVESLLNRELDTTTFAALARRTRSGATGTAAGTAGRR
jgi:Rrf2 family protein